MSNLAYKDANIVSEVGPVDHKVDAGPTNILRSKFLATMSHELKTPLNAIIGFSELLQSAAEVTLNKELVEEYAGYIHDSGTHLLNIINDILEMSRIENNNMPFHETEVSIAQLLHVPMTMIKNLAAEKRINLYYEVENTKIVLKVDEQKVRQSIINVVQNAVKFSNPLTTVSVLTGLDVNGDFYIRVDDEGIGIPNDKLEHVFKPFAQAENGLKRNHDGIGLGLSLVNAYMQMHNGRVRIDSKIDEGTSVTLIIPKSCVVS